VKEFELIMFTLIPGSVGSECPEGIKISSRRWNLRIMGHPLRKLPTLKGSNMPLFNPFGVGVLSVLALSVGFTYG
jgi:hypothetical protein